MGNQNFDFKKLPNGTLVAVKKEKQATKSEKAPQRVFGNRRTTEVLVLSDKFLYRRAFSTLQLLKAITEEDLKLGNSIHVITGGNVDQLSYLELMIMQQPLNYCLISTWVMGEEDIKQIEEWFEQGKLHKVDFYVGEIFPTQYTIGFAMLNNLIKKRSVDVLLYFVTTLK